ncbi:hypothetical protein CALVIDRAFT_535232 [Calocera viscosa TUFC12733]|uniref:F-box domain-containing protein n=1 Tax=Calocera viscosa (strain TUFC12733) TaxID=1330018 RepID=A0A167PBB6_CALVF|nr:hypothetical protein CALVIDRAFT_535232 [Calocera viscosa TUFC12733]
MHRAWTIVEVGQWIASAVAEGPSPTKSLFNMARTSHHFFDLAAPLLWRELRDECTLLNLLNILFDDDDDYEHIITDERQVQRFLKYCQFVRVIDIRWDDDDVPYLSTRLRIATSLLSDDAAQWFPSLKALQVACWSEPEDLILHAKFIVPSLRHIKLILPSPESYNRTRTWSLAVDLYLRTLARTAVDLRTFSLSGVTNHEPLWEPSLRALIRQLPLTSLRLTTITCTELIAEEASQKSTLEELMLLEVDAADDFNGPPYCADMPRQCTHVFSALRTFTIAGRPTVILNALCSIQAPLLKIEIIVICHHRERPERVKRHHYKDFANKIGQRYPCLEEIFIRSPHSRHDNEEIWVSDFQPLLVCEQMKTFHIERHSGIVVQHEDIAALARSWQRLRSLKLCCLPGTVNDGANGFSWDTLLILRQYCTTLEHLYITGFHNHPPVPVPPSPPPESPVKTLTILCPPPIVEVESVALFFSLLWPGVQLHTPGGNEWMEVISLLSFHRHQLQIQACRGTLASSTESMNQLLHRVEKQREL